MKKDNIVKFKQAINALRDSKNNLTKINCKLFLNGQNINEFWRICTQDIRHNTGVSFSGPNVNDSQQENYSNVVNSYKENFTNVVKEKIKEASQFFPDEFNNLLNSKPNKNDIIDICNITKTLEADIELNT